MLFSKGFKKTKANVRSKYLSAKEDLALFIKKFKRSLKNKGRDVKRNGDSSKNPKFQSQKKKSFDKKQEVY